MSGNEPKSGEIISVSGGNIERGGTGGTNTGNRNRNYHPQYRGIDQYNTPKFRVNI